jgi:hypothetical protein
MARASLLACLPVTPPAAGSAALDDLLDDLRPFARIEDLEAGRMEEQAYVKTSAGRVFTTRVEPLGDRRSVGFVSCHSFAWEQFELYPLELLFLRTAASAGFPSLSFQARGYNDSGGDFASVTPATHVRDAVAAAGFLKERTGVKAVVPVGVRFGAAVALDVAHEVAAPGVVLWSPSLEPGKYLDGLLRAFSVSGMMDEEGQIEEAASRPDVSEMKSSLAQGETVDLFGYPLSPACYAAAHERHPLADTRRAPGTALLVGVNPAKRREADRVRARLEELGATVTVEEAEGPGRAEFGLGIPRGGHLARHVEMFEDIVRRTVEWAKEIW